MKVALGVRNKKDYMAHITAIANGMRGNAGWLQDYIQSHSAVLCG